MSYKLVVCDMDGTLLTSQHRISDYTADIIKKIEKKGVKFLIATGRPFLDAKHYRDTLNLSSFLITSNGARAHNEKNEVIVAEDIPQKFTEKLLSYDLDRKKYHRNIYLDNDWFIEYEIEGLREFHEESGFQFQITDLDKFKNGAVTKIFFLAEENDLSITISSPYCLEFMKKGVNKAETLKKVLKILDISPNEVIAFGDSMNDYEMLSFVGKPFIMGNANKRLIESLPNVEVIGNNNEDAIGKKLQEIFEI